jgi:outer membrane protein OmpA-like peptidoglycan-associated protein
MKLTLLLSILFTGANFLLAQNKTKCENHPLFNALSKHSVQNCISKEFEKLDINKADPTMGSITLEKEGEYLQVAYSYDGTWEERPSETQIYTNYSNAISKAGGEVLYKGKSGLFGKVKKNGDVYWIKVFLDGSGWYWLETVRETTMNQEIVVSADEIKKTLFLEGKVAFYGILFDIDKAIIKPESSPTLSEISNFLKANTKTSVFIVGHTDNAGSFDHNINLSKERAAAVVNELISKYGVNKTQLNAQGVGPLSPVAPNDKEDGKAKNRRVEIVLK